MVHPDLLLRLRNLAATYRELGRDGDAVPLLERAVRVAEAGYGTEDPEVADQLGLLADVYCDLGLPGKAIAAETRALAILETSVGSDQVDLVPTLRESSG